ncbi:MAG: hypothetical protein H7343_09060 [Undibacterium sp.]|nr:hypothetical protein [Opitutaceae bacterium]
MAGWQNEFGGGPTYFIGEGRVAGIGDRRPYDTTGKRHVLTCYPAFEYHDESGKLRELTVTLAFRGYFEVGDKVRIGKTSGRIVVMDGWFRSQTYAHGCLLGLMLLGFSFVIFYRFRPSS